MSKPKPIISAKTLATASTFVTIALAAMIPYNPKHIPLIISAVFFVNIVTLVSIVYGQFRNK